MNNSNSLIKREIICSATTDKASAFGEPEAQIVFTYSKQDGLEIRRIMFK